MPRCMEIVNEELQRNLNKVILVKLRNGSEIRGVLIGYDQHLNLLLTDTEEINQRSGVKSSLMIIRGDTILFISPSIL
ncbi:LSM domain-containing protein [Vulcanisaeta souniana]|uniref:Small nuclear ribonucleoprotein (Sm) n=2 Tax=Vulcanisaeta souniana JCM 11219 TaxID=1293586 RepID=A0ABM8BQD0_9CREN|nr:LSM domain-containing protein [Vulcanisaeta souniana]BDR93251.1 small nuclear ribonucleoprotein (Sm) [Vulcanisaeta souniana JCM 11219]